MCGKMLGAIDRPMLPSGTPAACHKMREATGQEPVYMLVNGPIHFLKIFLHLPVTGKEPYDILIPSCRLPVLLITPRIVERTAVKHIAASVAAAVLRNSFLE